MKVAELKAALDELGVEYDASAKKPELEELLASAQELPAEEPAEEAETLEEVSAEEPEVFDGRKVLSKQEVELGGSKFLEYKFLDGSSTRVPR